MKSVDIYGDKLRAELEKRHLRLREASRELGFSEDHLSKCLNKNRAPIAMLKSLEMRYNIKYDDIVVPDRPVEPAAPEPVPDTISEVQAPELDIKALYQVIYKACFRAFREALTLYDAERRRNYEDI